jgi:hypothetical protein
MKVKLKKLEELMLLYDFNRETECFIIIQGCGRKNLLPLNWYLELPSDKVIEISEDNYWKGIKIMPEMYTEIEQPKIIGTTIKKYDYLISGVAYQSSLAGKGTSIAFSTVLCYGNKIKSPLDILNLSERIKNENGFDNFVLQNYKRIK